MDTITINGRSGLKTVFTKSQDGLWDVLFPDSYIRVLLDPDNSPSTILAIDPDGGPMFHIGDLLQDNLIIKEIFWDNTKGYRFRLEEQSPQ